MQLPKHVPQHVRTDHAQAGLHMQRACTCTNPILKAAFYIHTHTNTRTHTCSTAGRAPASSASLSSFARRAPARGTTGARPASVPAPALPSAASPPCALARDPLEPGCLLRCCGCFLGTGLVGGATAAAAAAGAGTGEAGNTETSVGFAELRPRGASWGLQRNPSMKLSRPAGGRPYSKCVQGTMHLVCAYACVHACQCKRTCALVCARVCTCKESMPALRSMWVRRKPANSTFHIHTCIQVLMHEDEAGTVSCRHLSACTHTEMRESHIHSPSVSGPSHKPWP